MKITISKSTVANSNALAKEFTEVTCKAFDLNVPPHVELGTTTGFENFSITADDQNYVFEMNDECLLKFMRLFVRTAKVLTPVIIMARTLITSLVKDFDEINEFIGKRK